MKVLSYFNRFLSNLKGPILATVILALAAGTIFAQYNEKSDRTAAPEGATVPRTYDFVGDNRTDLVMVSAASVSAPLVWRIFKNDPSPTTTTFNYGIGSDSITAGDYSNNDKTDVSISRIIGFWAATV
jgi:hypothetical protein